jgi:hypothetical protein
MKRIGLLAVVVLTSAAFVMGAVACSSSNDNNKDNTPQATEANTTPEATRADVTPGGSTTPNGTPDTTANVPVTLNAMGGSGVTGSATLFNGSAAGSTQVDVTIDGGLTEGTHQNHIHTGTCEAQGDVQDALTPLEAGADGKATGTTPAVPEDLSVFVTGNNYVAVHATDGTVVACGNIPAS